MNSATIEPSLGEEMEIICLGAGKEVGRSCIVVRFKGKCVMLDCGLHPGFEGIHSLPYFDEVDPAEVDLILISHFHTDHAAALPYFLEHTEFKGKVFATHATKAVMRLLTPDFSMVLSEDASTSISSASVFDKVTPIDFHQQREHNGIKFWPYHAGHVLGACMFMVEIAGVHVLYTGDFSGVEDRHLPSAEIPAISPDVVICESTYGIQVHEPIKQREDHFTGFVNRVASRGGRCLLPVFALGRVQELCLILEEHWSKHPELQDVPIYYCSSLASRSMKIFQTYINTLNKSIRDKFAAGSNPFAFRHIFTLRNLGTFEDAEPSVVLASPGMLQNGASRRLFDRWCTDSSNGLVVSHFAMDGTLAHQVMQEPQTITTLEGRVVPCRLSVSTASFSAHSDFAGTSTFLDSTQPQYIVLVHGRPKGMKKLQGALQKRVKDWKGKEKEVEIFTPENCEPVQLFFKDEKCGRILGGLASKCSELHAGDSVEGLLVVKDFQYHLMQEEDVDEFTSLKASTIVQRLHVPFPGSLEDLVRGLEQLYSRIEVLKDIEDVGTAVVVEDAVTCSPRGGRLVVEWSTSPANDVLADSIAAVALQINCSPLYFPQKQKAACSSVDLLRQAMQDQFGSVSESGGTLTSSVDGLQVAVDVEGVVGVEAWCC